MSDPGVRVPYERLDAREANLTAALTWVPHPHRAPANADLAALVADLRAARADNQRLRDEVARLAITYKDWVRNELCELTGDPAQQPARRLRRPLCECGHIHAADIDGSDAGCRVCECARFALARSPVPDLDAKQSESAFPFLRDYRAELERRIRAHMDEADASDDEGAHVGFARHHRALAAGLNEAVQALDAAWREREEPRA